MGFSGGTVVFGDGGFVRAAGADAALAIAEGVEGGGLVGGAGETEGGDGEAAALGSGGCLRDGAGGLLVVGRLAVFV